MTQSPETMTAEEMDECEGLVRFNMGSLDDDEKRIINRVITAARSTLEGGLASRDLSPPPVDLTSPQSDAWLPIESAPKDGTSILGWIVHPGDDYSAEPFQRPSIMYWDDMVPGEYGHPAQWEKQWIGSPTHWMPLPNPPAPDDGAGHCTASTTDASKSPRDDLSPPPSAPEGVSGKDALLVQTLAVRPALDRETVMRVLDDHVYAPKDGVLSGIGDVADAILSLLPDEEGR